MGCAGLCLPHALSAGGRQDAPLRRGERRGCPLAADPRAERGWGSFIVENAEEVVYGDCSDDDAERAETRIVPEPAFACTTPVVLTEENVPACRAYTECARDRVTGTTARRGMHETPECETVISMDASHAPFFSAPEELAGHPASLA